MKRTLEVLIVCAALAIISGYAWSHKDQVVALIIPSTRVAQTAVTPAPPAEAIKQTTTATIPAPDGNIPVQATTPNSAVAPILVLNKVPLTGRTESFTTLDGDQYTGIVKRVQPDGIILRTSDGVTNLKFKKLSHEIGIKYGYDPELENQFLKCQQAAAIASYQKSVELQTSHSALESNIQKSLSSISDQKNYQERLKTAQWNVDFKQKQIIDAKNHLNEISHFGYIYSRNRGEYYEYKTTIEKYKIDLKRFQDELAQIQNDNKLPATQPVSESREQSKVSTQPKIQSNDAVIPEEKSVPNTPSMHIKVCQVIDEGILGDVMHSAPSASGLARMGGSAGFAGVIGYESSGHIIYIVGIRDVTDDQELEIEAKRDGIYKYISTSGANRTVEKYTLTKIISKY